MSAKTEQIQIRVTPSQKAAIKRFARRQGQDLSTYVLERVLPAPAVRFEEILRALGDDDESGFALAELNDLLSGLMSSELTAVVAHAELSGHTPYLQNYVAAMVEQAAHRMGVAPPAWVRDVQPLEEPRFATSLRGLRGHLIRAAPVPFRRRNIFVDSGVGDRV